MKALLWIFVILGGVWMFTQLTSMPMSTFSLTSSAFENGGTIPSKYTCDEGGTVSPPLSIHDVPEGTKSLVLLMDDPDIPQEVKDKYHIEVFDHWALYNIPATTTEIKEGETIGQAGLNGSGATLYTGPCPPPQYEPKEHRYRFRLYALKSELSFPQPPTKQQVLDALTPHVISETELVGRYARQ